MHFVSLAIQCRQPLVAGVGRGSGALLVHQATTSAMLMTGSYSVSA